MSESKNPPLTLKIITPEGTLPDIFCDSITLAVSDNEKGKGGGSCGIRNGHADSLIALGSGEIRAFTKGEQVFSHSCKGGFARVSKNIITVLC